MTLLWVHLFFNARFAGDTEDAEKNNFSIAVERTAIEKTSAAYAVALSVL